MILKVQRIRPGAIIPRRQTRWAAGLDLHAYLELGFVELRSGAIAVIPTGVAIEFPREYVGQVCSRSGLATRGLHVLNAPGIIDSDFRGEIQVILHNASPTRQRIEVGDRIAQLLFVPCALPELELTTILSDTDRGSDGFGSTGV